MVASIDRTVLFIILFDAKKNLQKRSDLHASFNIKKLLAHFFKLDLYLVKWVNQRPTNAFIDLWVNDIM